MNPTPAPTMNPIPPHLMDPDLMPDGVRIYEKEEMEVYWCFRKLIRKSSLLFCFSVANLTTFLPLDRAFDEAHADADDRRPLILQECEHSSFQNCKCLPSGLKVNVDEVRYICQVLEGRKETRLWIEPAPERLNLSIPPHHWDDHRRVTWDVAVRDWDKGQMDATAVAYYANTIRYHIPNVTGVNFYRELLEHIGRLSILWFREATMGYANTLFFIAQLTWPRTPPSVKARFPDTLVDCDTPGVWQVKTGSPDRDAKDELAKILRGKNNDIWVVRRSGRKAFKDHVEYPIPEMLSVQDVNNMRRDLRDGDLFVRTSST